MPGEGRIPAHLDGWVVKDCFFKSLINIHGRLLSGRIRQPAMSRTGMVPVQGTNAQVLVSVFLHPALHKA